jgi:hypothetical protein
MMTPTISDLGKTFMTRGRPSDAQVKILVDKFVRMLPGQSFFIPGATRLDVEFLRRPVTRAGCGVQIVQVAEDEIYLQEGVRIWRLEGEYDDL